MQNEYAHLGLRGSVWRGLECRGEEPAGDMGMELNGKGGEWSGHIFLEIIQNQ